MVSEIRQDKLLRERAVKESPPVKDRRVATCEWEDEDLERMHGFIVYKTKCGHNFFFNDGTPTANAFIYCPFCGSKIKDVTNDDS